MCVHTGARACVLVWTVGIWCGWGKELLVIYSKAGRKMQPWAPDTTTHTLSHTRIHSPTVACLYTRQKKEREGKRKDRQSLTSTAGGSRDEGLSREKLYSTCVHVCAPAEFVDQSAADCSTPLWGRWKILGSSCSFSCVCFQLKILFLRHIFCTPFRQSHFCGLLQIQWDSKPL